MALEASRRRCVPQELRLLQNIVFSPPVEMPLLTAMQNAGSGDKWEVLLTWHGVAPALHTVPLPLALCYYPQAFHLQCGDAEVLPVMTQLHDIKLVASAFPFFLSPLSLSSLCSFCTPSPRDHFCPMGKCLANNTKPFLPVDAVVGPGTVVLSLAGFAAFSGA